MTETEVATEFSVEIDLNSLGRAGKHYHPAANSDECAKVAMRLGVIAVQSLEGDVRLTATKSEIHAVGVVRAKLVRECVASLEPMDEIVDEEFSIDFIRQAPAEVDEDSPEDDDLSGPELHEGDVFDIGELLVQQLSLAMAAFPRKTGAASLAEEYGQSGSDSPFAELQGFLEKNEKKQ